MKKTCSILIFTLMCATIYSQDILVYKNGDEIKAVVTEVNTSDVKYKKWDNQSGPSYTVLKNELFMIKYQNGSKDVFKEETAVVAQPTVTATENPVVFESPSTAPVKKDEAADILRKQNYDKNMKIYKSKTRKGVSSLIVGGGFLVVGAPTAVYGLSSGSLIGYDNLAGDVMLLVGGALTAISIPLLITGPVQLGKARKYKKMANDSYANVSVSPSLTPLYGRNNTRNFTTGVTVCLKF